VYQEWRDKAFAPWRNVEYLLGWDRRFFPSGPPEPEELMYAASARGEVAYASPGEFRTIENTGGYVNAVNTTAAAARGEILIVIADDQFPCASWDQMLCERLTRDEGFRAAWDKGPDSVRRWGGYPAVIHVSTGTPHEESRHINVLPILTRARYEQLGNRIFYPAYESMYADNDFFEETAIDGCAIEARDLLFEHRHYLFTPGVERDRAYDVQNRQPAYALGAQLFRERKARGFKDTDGVEVSRYLGETHCVLDNLTPPAGRVIALALPGEFFRREYLTALLPLYGHIVRHPGFHAVYDSHEYYPNPYVTRQMIVESLASVTPRPDLVLWLDDDNLLTPAQFDRMLATLDEHPELDALFAWCWIHNDEKTRFVPSCGMWSADHRHWLPFDGREMLRENQLRPLQVSGFPCVLMRWSAIEKAGEFPFLPILDKSLPAGLSGEDLSFCAAAERGGARFAVDPTIRVPHLKYVEVEPVFPPEPAEVPVSIAAMLRVKNEARWIRPVIEAIKPLTKAIYVFDDNSTDGTAEIARDAGAVVYSTPFAGEPLDEARDKNWLMPRVIADCKPEWILCIDGDEELEPEGAAKIRKAISHAGRVECFGLRFLHLWDRPDQIRIDRWYTAACRESLFKVVPGAQFVGYYKGTGKNEGLHCSNAPRGVQPVPLNVSLMHYGYMVKADRIRKWHWYNELDPNNEAEDCYRHMVQGDVPEVPADAVLKHAGPIELRTLPSHLVPKGAEYVQLRVAGATFCEPAVHRSEVGRAIAEGDTVLQEGPTGPILERRAL
jgi:hypothetical protein